MKNRLIKNSLLRPKESNEVDKQSSKYIQKAIVAANLLLNILFVKLKIIMLDSNCTIAKPICNAMMLLPNI
jgi:hypothetical protein